MHNYNEIVASTQKACNSCSQRVIEWYHATPHANVYLLVSGLLLALFLGRTAGRLKQPTWRRPRSPDPEKRTQNIQGKAACIEPGVWIPSDWERPDPEPYPGWDIHTTKPLPYRPFKWGPYHITMGTRSMKWDDWIEIDNEWQKFQDVKTSRIKERGERLSMTDPKAMDGAYELLEEFCDYLPKRYPLMFRKTEIGMDNLHTGEKFNIVQRPLGEDPMQMAGRMVQDDLAIMFEKSDSEYYLLAGSIIIPGFWRLEDKFQMRLSDIHTSGNVPGFKKKLEKGMMNFFRRVQPKDAVIRHNYSVQLDDNLAWSDSIGAEDEAGHGLGSDNTAKTGWQNADKNTPVEKYYYRSERQTLRRLPRSGGVVFTIRTYFHPITEIAQEPGVPGRLASAVRSWGEDLQKYKGQFVYKDTLLKYLDKEHDRQLEKGLVEGDITQEQDYPW